MEHTYFIKNNNFFVQDYSYEIKKKNNRLEINTNLEILGDFKLPERSLKISHFFPYQTVDNNYLNEDVSKTCVNINADREYNNCYVFRNTAFVNISNDKFFSKEVSVPTNVEFTTKFGIDSDDFLLSDDFQKSPDVDFFKFVNHIKWQEIVNNFQYQNTYIVSRKKTDSLKKTINLLDGWYIEKNKSNKHVYEKLNVHFFDYSNNKNQYIKNWFELDLKKNWNLTPTKQYLDFNFDDERHVYEIHKKMHLKNNFDKKTATVQFFTNFLKNSQKDVWFENLHSEKGLFFTKNTNGNLMLETQLFRPNKVDNIKFANFFTFKNNMEIEKNLLTTVYKSQNKKMILSGYENIDF